MRAIRCTSVVLLALLTACGAEHASQEAASGTADRPAPATATPAAATPAAVTEASPAMDDETTQVMRISSATGTFDCTGKDVEVVADGARLTLTGRCGGVFVIGGGNVISLESADVVQVSSGDGVEVTSSGRVNHVALIGSNGRHRFGAVGSMDVNSRDNDIEAASIDTLGLIGENNRVTWRTGTPSVNDHGSGNTVQPAGA